MKEKEKVELKEAIKPIETKVEVKASDVLIAPVMAEKAIAGQKFNQYVFKVSPRANKIDIAKEIKKIHNVKVLGVNIVNVSGKERRVGKTMGFKSGFKKAIITLEKGQSIELKQK